MRFYRALLRLYPASFRNEYGDELARLHSHRVAEIGALGASLEGLVDVVPNAIAEHRDILAQDLGYAVRAMRRAPAFVFTAVLVVALGVGANTAAFTLADFVLIRPLPFPAADRLVKVWQSTPGYGRMEASPVNFRDLKMLTRSFVNMGGYTTSAANLVGAGAPRRLTTAMVSFDVMPTLGVGAAMGRVIGRADSVASSVAVLSDGLWRSQFGADATVIGRPIRLDDVQRIVIGVMPPSFSFPTRDVDVWIPLVFEARLFADRNDNWLEVIARLRSEASLATANADVALAWSQMIRRYPKELDRTGARVIGVRDELPRKAKVLLLALCGAAACILLLACANLASLLLARGIVRGRELAVRAALGAGRERIVRQLTTESLLLATIGGAAGVLVAKLAIPLLGRLVPDSLPIAEEPTIDSRILLFAALVVAITGLAFGVLPAIRSGGARVFDELRAGARAGGGQKQRARSVLVAIEVAASVVLLISSGLLLRTMWRVQAVDPGFRTDSVAMIRTALPADKYALTARRMEFYDRVLAATRALPGVTSAAYTTMAPMTMGGGIWPVGVRAAPVIREDNSTASLRFATPAYFTTIGIPLRRGREIAESDDATRDYVAVVSESFVKRYWPNEDAIGKRFTFAFHDRTIVGVVGDVRTRGLERESEPQVYLPARQVEDSSLFYYAPKDLIVRSALTLASLVPAVRRIVHSIDPEQPISDAAMMAAVVADQTASRATQLRVLGILTAIALLLSGVGIYGLLSFTVSARIQEIGVRLALGAHSGMITRMILREGLLLGLAGLLPGVVVAYAAGRAMQSLLVGVEPGDAASFATAVFACLVITAIGCVRPALRASRIDPITALRSE